MVVTEGAYFVCFIHNFLFHNISFKTHKSINLKIKYYNRFDFNQVIIINKSKTWREQKVAPHPGLEPGSPG